MAAPLRIATYNVEWFNSLFDDRGRLLPDNELSGRFEVTRRNQIESLGIVFSALDADAIMVIEAPNQGSRRSTVKALETFARTFELKASRVAMGFANPTEQEIALLYNPDRIEARHDPQESAKAPRFDEVFRFDIDVDAAPEAIRFSKPPLELAVRADGHALRLIGVHVKSKAPRNSRTPAETVRIAIENRRQQLAECVWLRRRVAAHLAHGQSLIVMGDFNDGPGLDEYEQLFGHSGIEIVMGVDDEPKSRLHEPHARMALTQKVGISPSSARFWLAPQQQFFEALLDFIMVSPDLAARNPRWRIWHPLNDPNCLKIPELQEALLAASDHFPVTLDIEL
ncbi:endonuclease [Cereibacter sphaeroides]|uniref:endonuclease/exonuclease/phosphatase family protein n=1 Tax=Cereibacter sphaeroides TaxID=1063 RepID=UPI001F22890A|nr:endonuclease/exonuclease/phosphatase family protein [Cereibacter sphaeroides]MCE6951732.1 endonuclease [Cereibacter sphaeroides]